jgi:hypothetical protein
MFSWAWPTQLSAIIVLITLSCHSKIYNALYIDVISIEQRWKKCMKDVRKLCTMQSFSTPFMHSIHLYLAHVTRMSNYDTIIGWLMSRTWYWVDNWFGLIASTSCVSKLFLKFGKSLIIDNVFYFWWKQIVKVLKHGIHDWSFFIGLDVYVISNQIKPIIYVIFHCLCHT